jgi:hypothetical protein
MSGILFSILVVVALLSICGEIIMRVRLTRRASRDKIAWWSAAAMRLPQLMKKYFQTADSHFFGAVLSGSC